MSKAKQVTVDCLINYYRVKHDSGLSDRLGVTKGSISKWRNKGIPAERQAVFEVISNGKLKADLSKYDTAK